LGFGRRGSRTPAVPPESSRRQKRSLRAAEIILLRNSLPVGDPDIPRGYTALRMVTTIGDGARANGQALGVVVA